MISSARASKSGASSPSRRITTARPQFVLKSSNKKSAKSIGPLRGLENEGTTNDQLSLKVLIPSARERLKSPKQCAIRRFDSSAQKSLSKSSNDVRLLNNSQNEKPNPLAPFDYFANSKHKNELYSARKKGLRNQDDIFDLYGHLKREENDNDTNKKQALNIERKFMNSTTGLEKTKKERMIFGKAPARSGLGLAMRSLKNLPEGTKEDFILTEEAKLASSGNLLSSVSSKQPLQIPPFPLTAPMVSSFTKNLNSTRIKGKSGDTTLRGQERRKELVKMFEDVLEEDKNPKEISREKKTHRLQHKKNQSSNLSKTVSPDLPPDAGQSKKSLINFLNQIAEDEKIYSPPKDPNWIEDQYESFKRDRLKGKISSHISLEDFKRLKNRLFREQQQKHEKLREKEKTRLNSFLKRPAINKLIGQDLQLEEYMKENLMKNKFIELDAEASRKKRLRKTYENFREKEKIVKKDLIIDEEIVTHGRNKSLSNKKEGVSETTLRGLKPFREVPVSKLLYRSVSEDLLESSDFE